MLPFNRFELADALQRGDVTGRRHPTLPYTIYNYSPDVQWSSRWDAITLNCRGLILDDDFNVVARPWKKFFNLGQVNLPMQFDDPVEVMDKADGSLGILYPELYGEYALATRGSFASDQAFHATKVWQDNYAEYYNEVLPRLSDYTFLFEIVYPENRIVLNYDGMYDLIMLGAVQNSTGYYVGPREASAILGWIGPVVEVYNFNTLSDALSNMGRPNKEGYVIRSHNFLVKVKEPDYLELHRLVTNITPKTIWEQLKSGKSVDEVCSVLPDEFHGSAKSIAEPLVDAYLRRLDEIFAGYSRATDNVRARQRSDIVPRKHYALEFAGWRDAKYFFLMLDGKAVASVLWDELRPRESAILSSK